MSAPNNPKSAPRTQNILLVVAALVILILVILLVRLMLSQPKSPQRTEPARATEQPKSKEPTTLTGKWEVVSDVGHSAFKYIVGPSKVGDELEFMADGTLRMQSEALSYSIPEKNRLKIDVGMGYSGVYDYQIVDGQLTLNDGSEVFTLRPYKEVGPTPANLIGAWSIVDMSDVYLPGEPCLGFGLYQHTDPSLVEFSSDGKLRTFVKNKPLVGTYTVSGNTLQVSIPDSEELQCRVKLTNNLLRIYNTDGGADKFRAFTKSPAQVGAVSTALALTPIATAIPPTSTPRPVPFPGKWEMENGGYCGSLSLAGARYEFTQDGAIRADYARPTMTYFPNHSFSLSGVSQVNIDGTIYNWTSDGNTLAFTDPTGSSLGCKLYHPIPLTPSPDTLQRPWRTDIYGTRGVRGMELILRSDATAEIWSSGLDRQKGTYKVQGELLTVLLDSPIQFSAGVTTRELTFVIRELTKNRLTLRHDEAVTRVLGASPEKGNDSVIVFLPE